LTANAGHELEEGAPLRGDQLRTLADDLGERLRAAADALDKLRSAGWSATVAMYDAFLVHDEVRTKEEAERQLQALGIDPSELMIIEDEEEDEEF
jgi:hypothetical protein